MPHPEAQLAKIHLAERKKQHGENQQWLNRADGLAGDMMRRLKKRQVHIDEITADSSEYGNDERPIFQKSYDFHTIIQLQKVGSK